MLINLQVSDDVKVQVNVFTSEVYIAYAAFYTRIVLVAGQVLVQY